MATINDFISTLIHNGESDAKNLGEGLKQTVIKNVTGQNGMTPTDMIGNTAIQMGKGLVDEYGNLVGVNTKDNKPLLDPNKSIFQPGGIDTSGVTFSPKAAVQHAYNHPLNTVLDLIPVAKGLKGATAGEATVEGTTVEAPGVRSMSAPKVSDIAANTYMKPYTIPAGLDVNPVNTAKWMISDNPNLGKIQNFLGNVESIKRNVLGTAGQKGVTVPINDTMTGGMNEIKAIPQLQDTPKKLLGYQQELRSMMPTPSTDINGNISGANPLDTYDSIKNIEQQGYAYKNGGLDRYGNISNPELYKVGNAYINTAKELEAQLDQSVGKENVQAHTLDPQVQSQIGQFSPNVAERLANNVKNWSDLRALQKPYMDMNKIIDYTNKAGHTAFANLSGGSTRAITGGAGAAIGGAVGGVPGAVVGGVAGSLLEPTFSAIGNKMLPAISKGVASTMNGLPNIPQIGTSTLPPIGLMALGAEKGNQGSNNNINGQNTNSPQGDNGEPITNKNTQNFQSNHVNSISQGVNPDGTFSTSNLPQTMGDTKLNPDGTVSVANPTQIKDATGKVIAIDDNDANKQIQALQNDIAKQHRIAAADPYTPGTQTSTAQIIAGDNAQLASLKALRDSSIPLNNAYEKISSITGKTATALKTLNAVSPNLSNLNTQIDNIQNNLDPAYASLKQQLIGIQKSIGGGNLDVKTKDALVNVLKTINQQNAFDYYRAIQKFVGVPAGNNMDDTSQNMTQFPPQSNVLPSPTSAGVPSIPQGNINWQANDPKVQAIMGQ